MNEELTIGKVKNIIIMLMHSITKENISIVDHFLDDNLTARFNQIISENIKKNVKQKFDLPNISNIAKKEHSGDNVIFSATIRFCDYKVDRKNNKVVEGNNLKATTHNVLLHFRHKNVEEKTVYKCPFCGAGISINTTSICPYCTRPLDERYSEYVLTDITY